MSHSFEVEYGLSSTELLDALHKHFRAKVAFEGVVAEVQLEQQMKALKASGFIQHYEEHDQDAYHDFTVWLPGRKQGIRIECKNIRDADEGYRKGGAFVACKVETQKTRTSGKDRTSRFYNLNQFDVLAVCLGKKTHQWNQFLFIKTSRLEKHHEYPNKLAVIHRVPLPENQDIAPWHRKLEDVLTALGRE